MYPKLSEIQPRGAEVVEHTGADGKPYRVTTLQGVLVAANGGVSYLDSEGNPHSENDEPCIISEGYKEWRKHGILHRDIGPARISSSKTIYAVDGAYHRLDGPAVEWSNEYKQAAIEVYGSDKEFWIDGVQYSETEYWDKVSGGK